MGHQVVFVREGLLAHLTPERSPSLVHSFVVKEASPAFAGVRAEAALAVLSVVLQVVVRFAPREEAAAVFAVEGPSRRGTGWISPIERMTFGRPQYPVGGCVRPPLIGRNHPFVAVTMEACRQSCCFPAGD